MTRNVLRDFLPPVVLLLLLTALISLKGLDMAVECHFFVPGLAAGWPVGELTPWKELYHYGVYPSYIIGGASLAVLIAGCFSARAYVYRKCAAFFLLLLLLGPGLLVNTVLKDHWGRPRPRQMQVFGGDSTYHQVWERGEAGKYKSFPSGHASAAFYLIAPYFVLRRSSRKRAGVALAGGMVYGVLMGIARMAQGGHFLSDILWAWGCVYLVGLSLYYLTGLHRGALLAPKAEPVPAQPELAE